MPNYRRDYSGSVWFFTVVTHLRKPFLTQEPERQALRRAVRECRSRYPFSINGWVLLPDHLHCIWTLPENDPIYSRRWGVIKRLFTQQMQNSGGHGPPYWQQRFWAHRIDDEADYEQHMNHIHFNPAKHGYANRPAEWPWTTLHRCIREGIYPADWGGAVSIPTTGIGRE